MAKAGEKNSEWKINKVWEELIAYFPLIRHEPHRKRRVQQSPIIACVLIAAVTFLPSRCLATYT
jgi:hypothetical protein